MATIMTVDDEPNIVELVKAILEKEKHDVIIAHSGQECLDKLDETTPDLILLDIKMPDLSGWDVYNRIRDRGVDSEIVFVSMFEVSSDELSQLKDKGVADYIEKPFSRDELVRRVEQVLQERLNEGFNG